MGRERVQGLQSRAHFGFQSLRGGCKSPFLGHPHFLGFCKPVAPFESGKQSLLLRVYGLPPVYTTKVWDVSSHSFRFSGFGLALFFFGFAAHFVRSF